jgi:hypothetical protein
MHDKNGKDEYIESRCDQFKVSVLSFKTSSRNVADIRPKHKLVPENSACVGEELTLTPPNIIAAK